MDIPIWSLGQDGPLEEQMATHSSILAWKIPSTEEPGRLQSTRLQRVGHDWVTKLSVMKCYMNVPKNKMIFILYLKFVFWTYLKSGILFLIFFFLIWEHDEYVQFYNCPSQTCSILDSWHFVLENSWFWGAILGILRCLTASLVSTQLWQAKMFPDIARPFGWGMWEVSESLVLRTTVVQEILASLKLLTLVSETFSGGIFLRLYFSKNDMVSASFSFILHLFKTRVFVSLSALIYHLTNHMFCLSNIERKLGMRNKRHAWSHLVSSH